MITDEYISDYLAAKKLEPKFQKKAAAEDAKSAAVALKNLVEPSAGNAIAGLTKPEEPICADIRATLTTLRKAMKWEPEPFRYARQTTLDQQTLWSPHKAKLDSLSGELQKSRWVSYRASGGDLTRDAFYESEKGKRQAAKLAMAQCARKAAAAWRPVPASFTTAATVFIDGMEEESKKRCRAYLIGYRGNSLTTGLRLALKTLDKSIRSDDAISGLDSPSSFSFID